LYGEAVNVETLKPTRKEIKVRTE